MNLKKESARRVAIMSGCGLLKRIVSVRYFSIAPLISEVCRKGFFILFSFFCLLTFNAHAAVDVTIKTDVLPDPCDVTLSGGTDGQGNVSFGTIASSSLGDRVIVHDVPPLSLKISGCKTSVYSPTLTVGATFAGTTPEGGSNQWLINPGQADLTKAGNVGFVMNFGYTSIGWAANKNATSINLRADCTVITTATANACGAKMPSPWLDVDIPIAVGVSRGYNTTYRSGPLDATVTFTVSYP